MVDKDDSVGGREDKWRWLQIIHDIVTFCYFLYPKDFSDELRSNR